jgi:hypothetical protein
LAYLGSIATPAGYYFDFARAMDDFSSRGGRAVVTLDKRLLSTGHHILAHGWLTGHWHVALQRRKKGQRLCLVIVAEGAIDKNGKDIKAEYVKDVIVQV